MTKNYKYMFTGENIDVKELEEYLNKSTKHAKMITLPLESSTLIIFEQFFFRVGFFNGGEGLVDCSIMIESFKEKDGTGIVIVSKSCLHFDLGSDVYLLNKICNVFKERYNAKELDIK